MTRGFGGKRYGVVAGDQQRTMSGLEFVQGLVTGALPLNSMAETLGYDIVEASPGRVTVAAEPISLVRPVTVETGLMRAEGNVVFRGRRIGTAEGRLTDTQGRILAHGTTTCLIFES
jgi:hypothetical protein